MAIDSLKNLGYQHMENYGSLEEARKRLGLP